MSWHPLRCGRGPVKLDFVSELAVADGLRGNGLFSALGSKAVADGVPAALEEAHAGVDEFRRIGVAAAGGDADFLTFDGIGERKNADSLILIEPLQQYFAAVLKANAVAVGIGFKAELGESDKLGFADGELLAEPHGDIFEHELGAGWDADGNQRLHAGAVPGRLLMELRLARRGEPHGAARKSRGHQRLAFRRKTVGMSV